MTLLNRSLLSASLGALVYGGWAFYVNSAGDTSMGLKTAFVQGSFSFALTMTLTLIIEHLFNRIGTIKGGAMLTLATASLFMFCAAYGLQLIAGAPHILMTILPGWVIGSVYAGTYTLSLYKSNIAR